MIETEKFKIRFICLTKDLRTNKWEFKCKKCGNTFNPPTTVSAIQNVVCEKCEKSETINYNEIIID